MFAACASLVHVNSEKPPKNSAFKVKQQTSSKTPFNCFGAICTSSVADGSFQSRSYFGGHTWELQFPVPTETAIAHFESFIPAFC